MNNKIVLAATLLASQTNGIDIIDWQDNAPTPTSMTEKNTLNGYDGKPCD